MLQNKCLSKQECSLKYVCVYLLMMYIFYVHINIECENQTAINNGTMQVIGGVDGIWTYNSTVYYVCETGFNLTFNVPMRCLSNGTWEGRQPACDIVTCLPPTTPSNGSILSANTIFQYMDDVWFSCHDGFNLIGANTTKCNETGQWSSGTPKCQIRDCGNLTNPTNGSVQHTGGTTVGQIAYYNCSAGYMLNGTTNRTCNASGIWTLETPTCDVICKFYSSTLVIYIDEMFIERML